MQVGRDEQRVVVEHLLEVRHEPALVHRVAVEAAADEVVHPAERHPVERLLGGVHGAAAQEQLERRRGRELRRPPEAAPLRVEQLLEAAHRLEEQRLGQRLARRPCGGRLLQRVDEDLGAARHVLAPLAPELRDGDEHLLERRQPVARLGREVRPAQERLARRCEEGRQGPAAVAGHRDDGVHVDPVEVGPLLAVDLDADEALVHQSGRHRVLERLPLHHVAPVAGGVADREQDRPVLVPRAGERLLAPGVPVDRVLGVLEEVRARLVRQPVHGFVR